MSLENLTDNQQYYADSMEAAGIPTTEDGLKQKFEEMAEGEGLVFKNPGEQSVWWRWLRLVAVVPVLWLIEFIIKGIIPNQFVKTATGNFLDLLAWTHGLTRKDATKAQGLIKFSRDNSAGSLSIPLGTWVHTTNINGTVYKVKTTQLGEFLPGELDLWVTAEAEQSGTAYNLADNYYIVLAEPIAGISAVTNDQNWLTTPGADKETDEQFRTRIRGHFSSVSDHHVTSVYKTMISENVGIAYDRIFIDYTLAPRGPGSANAYVLFDLDTPAQSYLDTVNDYITNQGHHGLGDDMQVFAMPSISYDLGGTIWIPAGMSAADAATLFNNVEQMIRCAFRENNDFDVTQTWPFSRFSMSRLAGSILRKYPDVESIEFNRGDITSNNDIAQLGALTLTAGALL
jgi:uncharacterized phage protein gp47/JayE